MADYTIQVMENAFGKSGNGFNRKPIFKFTGTIEKFDIKAFERKLKSIRSNKKLMTWIVATFFYSFTMRVALSL